MNESVLEVEESSEIEESDPGEEGAEPEFVKAVCCKLGRTRSTFALVRGVS